MASEYIKDPDANLDYPFDWSDWLPSGDTISSVTWVVSSGLIQGTTSNTATSATIWLSGGTSGNAYSVTCRITTSQGRIEDRTITIRVSQR